jgi:hypothetical protein
MEVLGDYPSEVQEEHSREDFRRTEAELGCQFLLLAVSNIPNNQNM